MYSNLYNLVSFWFNQSKYLFIYFNDSLLSALDTTAAIISW